MRDIHMSTKRFAIHVKEEYDAGVRFCFILGAGASYTSHIPTGQKLMPLWREELRGFGMDVVRESAAACGIPPEEWEPLFRRGAKLRSEDYFTLFDLRFAGKPVTAYHYLQNLMEAAKPSIGYYMLAVLLENTDNKLVITTNFDTLVEDVLHLYNARHPLVAGHESLAPFIGKVENVGRPVVAKVHRDLLLQPLNRKEELEKLADGWKESLRAALSKYVPIVIGYAGGDQTLMKLLEEVKPESIFWCALEDLEPDRDGGPGRTQRLLEACPGGHLVKIRGFDEVMFELVRQMKADGDYAFESPSDRMKNLFELRLKSYQEQYKKLNDQVLDDMAGQQEGESGKREDTEKGGEQPDPAPRDTVPPQSLEGERSLTLLDRLAGQQENAAPAMQAAALRRRAWGCDWKKETEQALEYCDQALRLQPEDADLWHLRDLILFQAGRYGQALESGKKAVTLAPEVAEYHYSYGATLNILKFYEQALREKGEAVRLAPDNARYWDSRSTTLHAMKRYREALADSDEAVRLAPGDAGYRWSRGVTLHELGRYEEALAEKREAVRLAPENAEYRDSCSTTLHTLGRYEEALEEEAEAVRLAPDNARYRNSYGVILYELGRYEQALAEETEAVRLAPQKAVYRHTRGVTLHKLGRYEEALEEKQEAVRLAPDSARYHHSCGVTLSKLKRYEQALAEKDEAVRLAPDNPKYRDSRSTTLHLMKRYEQALEDSNEAVRLAPDNPDYYESRSATLERLGRNRQAKEDRETARRLRQKKQG